MKVVLIGLFGAVGALARYELSRSIHRRSNRRDLATMIVNLSGALLLGLVVGIDRAAPLDPDMAAALSIGFLGGYTTFSTWMVDVIVLTEDRKSGRVRGLSNLAGTVVGGLLAFGLGRLLAELVA
jgi:CrcB protein